MLRLIMIYHVMKPRNLSGCWWSERRNLDSTDPNKSKQHESIMYPLDNKRSLITPKYQGIKSNTNNINIKPWIVQTPKQKQKVTWHSLNRYSDSSSQILHAQTWRKGLLQLISLLSIKHTKCVQVLWASNLELDCVFRLLDFHRTCILPSCS